MKVLSLFDGISCGRVALERAGIPITKYYASEIDKHAEAISKFHYPDIVRLGDVTKWQEWDIEQPDIILAGFPCQSFSLAGKRLNFDDDRGKLFFTLCDILEYYKPKYFLLENVQMKSSIERAINLRLGEIFPQYAQPELLSAGEIKPYFLNSALVSAQSRKRNYWRNWRVGKPNDHKNKSLVLRDVLESCVDKKYYVSQEHYEKFLGGKNLNPEYKSQCNTIHDLDEKAPCLCSGSHGYSYGYIDENQPNLLGNIGASSQGQRVYSQYGKSCTLSSCGGGLGAKTGLYLVENGIRRLTPIECERLQTLPYNFTEKGIYDGEIKEVANTNRYKAIGNGWTVDMIVHILKNNKKFGG